MNTTTQTVDTIREALREAFNEAMTSGNKAASLQNKVNEERNGAYATMTKAALMVFDGIEDREERTVIWSDTWSQYCEDIKFNRGGLASKLRCAKAKAKKGKPQEYKVSSAASAAGSYLGDAFGYGINLYDDGTPLSFGAIREAVQKAKEAKRIAALPANYRALHALIAEVRELGASYAESFDAIRANDEGGEWCSLAAEACTTAIESLKPFIDGVHAALREADDSDTSNAGEAVADEADEKPRRSKKAA